MVDREGSQSPSTLVVPDRGEHRTIQRIRLTVVGGKDQGAVFESSSERVVLGTHERCDVVLHEQTASRWHAELAIARNQVTITDLGSSNGTTVNGVRVERAFLGPGAIVGLGRATLRFDLAAEPVKLPVSGKARFGEMVGASVASRATFALLELAAPSDATVLLTGETGTGKEIAARSLHAQGPRARGPMVVVDCTSIPADLLESELFGHARGSFSGAIADRVGAFEAAHNGTIFLDEIGELPLGLQPKLLRALEAREIKPVGVASYRPINVRVIAATHRDLAREVAAGRFRSDLYYRLAVVEVRLPALRDRLDDVPLIVDALVAELELSEADAAAVRSPAFLAAVRAHGWPGNVRELRNYVERVLTLGPEAPPPGSGGPIGGGRVAHPTDGADALGALVDVGLPLKVAREIWTAEFERRYVTALVEAHGGNVSAAARAAGVDRSHLHRLIAKARAGGPGEG